MQKRSAFLPLLLVVGCSDGPNEPSFNRIQVPVQHQMACPTCVTWRSEELEARLQTIINDWMQGSECVNARNILQAYIDDLKIGVWNDPNTNVGADWHWGSAIHFNLKFETLSDYQIGWMFAHEAGHEYNWSSDQTAADDFAEWCMPGGNPSN
jgi:hypothetical protein